MQQEGRDTALAILGAGLLALSAGYGCDDKEGSAPSWGGRGGGGWGQRGETAAIPVRAEAVERRDMYAYVQTHARLEAERSVGVVARAAGLVMELLAEEGSQVAAGQALARLDKDQLVLWRQQAQVAVDQAELAHERTTSLFDRALVSQEELDAARHQLENARLNLAEADLNLEYGDIRAPIAGIVMRRDVELGDMVNPNQALFTIADLDPLLARIRIPESRLQQVSVGQPAKVEIDALAGGPFSGEVRMINPGVDPASGTVKVTLEVPAGDNGLRPGMFAAVRLITGVHPATLVVPKQALILETDADDVLLFDDGLVRRARVELGYSEGDRVEIVSGLRDGDQVITVGQEGLKDGQSVRLAGILPPLEEEEDEAAGTRNESRQWGPGRGGGEGRAMPDSATFVGRLRERWGLSEAAAVERWRQMKQRMGSGVTAAGLGPAGAEGDSSLDGGDTTWRGGGDR